MLSLRRWRWQRRCVLFSLFFFCLVGVTFIINPPRLSHVIDDIWIVKTPLRGDAPVRLFSSRIWTSYVFLFSEFKLTHSCSGIGR